MDDSGRVNSAAGALPSADLQTIADATADAGRDRAEELAGRGCALRLAGSARWSLEVMAQELRQDHHVHVEVVTTY